MTGVQTCALPIWKLVRHSHLIHTMPAKIFAFVALSFGAHLGQSCDVTKVFSGTCGDQCIAEAGQSCSDCSSTNICCASGTCHMKGTCAAGDCPTKAGDTCNDCTNTQYCTCDDSVSANSSSFIYKIKQMQIQALKEQVVV